MIVATTTCCNCENEIQLDDEYGWDEHDNNAECIVCDDCIANERKED